MMPLMLRLSLGSLHVRWKCNDAADAPVLGADQAPAYETEWQ